MKNKYVLAISICSGLVMILSGCGQAGTTEPEPFPHLVTEEEARTRINDIFIKNGINLEADVPFSFYLGDPDPYNLELDGFNKELNIGYEYI